MAKKSKTQRAKASVARAQKKVEAEVKAQATDEQLAKAEEADAKKTKKPFFKKAEALPEPEPKKLMKKEEKKPAKKRRFGFFSDVRAELRRVTWPTRQDVLRWSLVVVGALIFFGLYVLLLDNGVVTPLLLLISGLGA
ncbi:MAG: preprotein translocase subunit SecE [Coriobacteriaceae bacterium]|jgi:preprotein translocase subunit SecE|nr:preprotein translocase subunit SecE [Coriobacteriaceae bacterium]